jgi:spore coat polysaccharide biosynthesis protein SpsF
MRVVAVVQARMGSQRLPGKVLAQLGDRPVIDWVVGRCLAASGVDAVVVATSTDPADAPLAEHCRDAGVPVFRGPLDDVLARFAAAADTAGAEHVVRVTGDCPLVDPAVIDEVVDVHLREGHDFTANRLPPPHRRTYPIGLDVEVVTRSALAVAESDASSPHHREHVLPYLYEVPGRFDVRVVESPVDAGDVRWTIDTPEDLAAVRGLVEVAGADLRTPWRALLEAWQAHPEVAALNAGTRQRTATDVDARRAP